MRLLFLTNFYPPGVGGYEQWCQEAAEGLRERGHSVLVLTSGQVYGERQPDPEWLQRSLHTEMEAKPLRNSLSFFTSSRAREQHNLATLSRTMADWSPDAVLIWGMWNLHRSLAALAERLLPDKVVYYIGDYWPLLPSQHVMYWHAPGRHWLTRLPKRVVGNLALRMLSNRAQARLKFTHAMFPTHFLMDELCRQGVVPVRSKVVSGAVDTRPFLGARPHSLAHMSTGQPLALLYAGRLAPEKGVQTAIEGAGRLVHRHGLQAVRLNIVGTGAVAYETELHGLVRRQHLEGVVHFLGLRDKRDMPALYAESDILLFTSEWPEPFGRVLVEAMAAGVGVVGTATGGAAEILRDGDNALTFSAADPDGLAAQVVRLVESPALYERLVRKGQQTSSERFALPRMLDGLEGYLAAVVA